MIYSPKILFPFFSQWKDTMHSIPCSVEERACPLLGTSLALGNWDIGLVKQKLCSLSSFSISRKIRKMKDSQSHVSWFPLLAPRGDGFNNINVEHIWLRTLPFLLTWDLAGWLALGLSCLHHDRTWLQHCSFVVSRTKIFCVPSPGCPF